MRHTSISQLFIECLCCRIGRFRSTISLGLCIIALLISFNAIKCFQTSLYARTSINWTADVSLGWNIEWRFTGGMQYTTYYESVLVIRLNQAK